MTKGFFVLLGFLSLNAAAAPQGAVVPALSHLIHQAEPLDSPDTMTGELAVGIGFNLCQPKGNPPLEEAFLCSGLQPSLENISVTLLPMKTANPEWRLWSGRYVTSTAYKAFKGELELLVSYAKVDGKVYVFVDGRMTDNKKSKPTYFRVTTTSFPSLNGSYYYGQPVAFKNEDNIRLDWVPVVSVAPKFKE